MHTPSSINVSLTPELEVFVRERLATGNYATPSDVIREGLYLLQDRERLSTPTTETLKAKLERAAAQADRNELVDGDAVFAKLDTLIERRRLEQAAH